VSVLWSLEPATAAKHELYKRYLDAWWPIMLQPSRSGRLWPRITYLDAFAGPGRYTGGQEGSPVFALSRLLNHVAAGRMQLSRNRVRLVFMEKHRRRYQHLLGELTGRFGPLGELPVRVEVRNGEAGADAGAVLGELGAWGHPLLAVFDSWGNVNVPLSLIERVARNKASEVIVTFAPNWFSRRQDLDAARLDAVFGGRAHWAAAAREDRPEERWRAWLAVYRDALRRAGFSYQLQFRVVPRTGQPLYLVYGTGNPKGLEVMKEAMWDVDVNEGIGFQDPRTRGAELPGQQTLWAGVGTAHPELAELARQRLAGGPVTVGELGQWLLTQTARWRARDASQAVRDLQHSGLVSVHPDGRLTGKSVIRLA
jgi:three-Cys-motif partner protein